MQTGDELTIRPESLVAGGDALARVDGLPVFIANVYPGDVARVRLLEVKKGFAKAELVQLVEPSSWRRVEPCPVAGECGGCDWTALRLDKQLEAKRQIVVESLRRIGKFDVAALPEIALHPSPLSYRLRSRLHRDGERVGFYALRSNRVVPLPQECEVVGSETAARFGSATRVHDVPQSPAAPRDDIEVDETPAPGEIWELDGRLTDDERELTITVGEFRYRLSTRAFFQVNRHLLGTLLRLVTSHAEQMTNRHLAIDLYAGVGFFTLPLAELFHRVTAVEGSPIAVRYGRINAPRNVKYVQAAVEEHAVRLPKADFVFLDPPRAGAKAAVIDAIAERAKEGIAYLSCDPVTFARDAGRLTASGWRLRSLDLLDLFPNTHHIETLSSFERAG